MKASSESGLWALTISRRVVSGILTKGRIVQYRMLQGLRGKKLVETTSKSKGDRLPGREPETKFAPINFAQSAGAGFAPFPVVLKLHHRMLTHARLKRPPSDWHGSIATSHRAHSAVLVDSGAPLQTDFRS